MTLSLKELHKIDKKMNKIVAAMHRELMMNPVCVKCNPKDTKKFTIGMPLLVCGVHYTDNILQLTYRPSINELL